MLGTSDLVLNFTGLVYMLLACFDIQKVRNLQPSEGEVTLSELFRFRFDKAHLQKVAQGTEFSFCAHQLKTWAF